MRTLRPVASSAAALLTLAACGTGTGQTRGQDAAVGTDDGRLLLLTSRGVAGWGAGVPLPTTGEPAAPRTVEVRTLAEGDQPEVGVRYHAPLHVHCGMDWLYPGGEPWRRTDDGPDVSSEGDPGAEG